MKTEIETRIMLRASGAILDYSLVKLHFPQSGLQPIETFDQAANIILASGDRLAFRLAHVDFLFKTSVKKRRLYIELDDVYITCGNQSKNNPKSGESDNVGKRFSVVQASPLRAAKNH